VEEKTQPADGEDRDLQRSNRADRILADPAVINRSAMVERPGPILRWLGRTFFGAVKFEDSQVKAIRDACARGIPVYVTRVVSTLDYLYFNHAFLRFSLPRVFFGSRLNLILFRPVKEVFGYLFRRMFGLLRRRLDDREMMRRALNAGRPCLVSLKRNRKLIQWGGDERLSHLRDLIEIQKDLERPLILVPLMVVWDKKPESYRRSVMDWVFGDPQTPGRLRKLVAFALNFRSARARTGKVINLRDFVEKNVDAENDDVVAARLKFALAQEFLLESKAIRGPALKGARRVVDEIMRTQPMIEDIRKSAEERGVKEEVEMQRARAMLIRMAADFRFKWLEGFAFVLGLLFQRLYQGIAVDDEGLDRIREAARKAPIVMVPAHRSHIDYLLLSVLCYTHGLIVPHIAAGDNLSFWPMGPIFRHCGAFFIRRAFKQDNLYKNVLAQYVRKLLKEGYWIEFFIEGTRSRSGKSLTPKYGMLAMIVDAVASGAAPDANLMPVAVTYEKVIEEKSYQAETAGSEKQRESAMTLASSAGVLGSRWGKVYVEFDRPLSLVSFLRSQGITIPLPTGDKVPREVVRRLSYILVHRINQCLVVTPHHLVSFALLSHPKRGIEREVLLERVGFLVAYLVARKANLSDLVMDPLTELGLVPKADAVAGLVPSSDQVRTEAIGMTLQREVDDVLRIFLKEKRIKIREYGDDWVASVLPEGRAALDYYKCGLIHFFVRESLMAHAVLMAASAKSVEVPVLAALTKDLSRVFKFEFIYGADHSFEDLFRVTLAGFRNERLVFGDDFQVKVGRDAFETLEYFAGIVKPFVEAYRILGRTLLQGGEYGSDKEVIKAAVRLGRKMYEMGDVVLAESISTVLFGNALKYLKAEMKHDESLDIKAAAEAMLKILGGEEAG